LIAGKKDYCSVLIISRVPVNIINTPTAWCAAPSEKPIVAYVLNFPAFYGTAKIIVMFTKAHVMYCLIVPELVPGGVSTITVHFCVFYFVAH
jgi:hypothetical protein